MKETLLFGRMGSAEFDTGDQTVLLSPELMSVLGTASAVDGLVCSVEEFLSRFVVESYRNYLLSKIIEFAERSEEDSVSLSFAMHSITGAVIWVESKWIRKDKGLLVIIQDVTEKKTSVTESVIKSNMISNMLFSISDGFFALDRYLNFTLVNPTFSKLARMPIEEMLGKNLLDLFPAMKGGTTVAHYTEALTRNVAKSFETRSGETIFEVLAYPHSEGLFVYFRDVTMNRSLMQEQRKLDKIVRETHNEIYIINYNTLHFEYANGSALKNIGYTQSELLNLKFTDLFNFPDDFAANIILNTLRNNESDRINLTLKYRRKDDSVYDAEVMIQVLEHQLSFVVFVTDITSRIVTEKKLLDNILEKEVLIQEIHHRVKNNLQLISTILFLKLLTVPQHEFRTFLESTRNRIHSIALIHERLLQTQSLDKVDMKDYLSRLISAIEIANADSGVPISVVTNIERRTMKLDAAIFCGLIVNELVMNAFKHAFSGRETGHVDVSFVCEETTCILKVSDNGNVLPPAIEPGTTTSFGMQLLDVFVKQLHGSMKIFRENGTTFQIMFCI